MRQRLGLAAALLRDPELLILDEPANGLDPEGVHWLRTFMRSFAAAGKTVLVSSHVLAEVAQTVDRVVIIDKGRLVTIAALDELTARMTAESGSAQPGSVLFCPRSRPRASRRPPSMAMSCSFAERRRRGSESSRWNAGIPVHELVQESSTLEKVFLELTSGGDS